MNNCFGQICININNELCDNLNNKVKIAIDRIQSIYNPLRPFYVAYSGGKDSNVINKLVELAQVKFTLNYNLTTVDNPELVKMIKNNSDVIIHKPHCQCGS